MSFVVILFIIIFNNQNLSHIIIFDCLIIITLNSFHTLNVSNSMCLDLLNLYICQNLPRLKTSLNNIFNNLSINFYYLYHIQ